MLLHHSIIMVRLFYLFMIFLDNLSSIIIFVIAKYYRNYFFLKCSINPPLQKSSHLESESKNAVFQKFIPNFVD